MAAGGRGVVVIRYTISKHPTDVIRPWRVHMLDFDNGTITLIAMRQTWSTCCSWLQRRIAGAPDGQA